MNNLTVLEIDEFIAYAIGAVFIVLFILVCIAIIGLWQEFVRFNRNFEDYIRERNKNDNIKRQF